MARALLGAKKKSAFDHYEQALALAPDRNVVLLEYASGLLLLEGEKRRAQARDLLVRVIELPPQDAFQRIRSSTGHRAVGGSRRRGDIPIGAVSYRNATVYQK